MKELADVTHYMSPALDQGHLNQLYTFILNSDLLYFRSDLCYPPVKADRERYLCAVNSIDYLFITLTNRDEMDPTEDYFCVI